MTKKLLHGLLLLAFFACSCRESHVLAQDSLSDAAKERLKERDRNRKEMRALRAQGKLAEAIASGERALAIDREVLGNSRQEVAIALNELAGLYFEQEDFVRALGAFRQALAISTKVLGENHWYVVNVRFDLAYVDRVAKLQPEQRHQLTKASQLLQKTEHLEHQEKYLEAIGLAREAMDLRGKILGEKSVGYGDSLNTLANLWCEMGRHDQAEPLYQRSLAIMEAEFGKEHPKVSDLLNNLANLYSEMGEHTKAENLYRRSLQIRETRLGKDHPYVADAMNNLANLYSAIGRYADAERLYRHGLEIQEARLGKDHPRLARTLNNLGTLHERTGRYPEAKSLYQRGLEIREAKLGKDHSEVAESLNNLASLYGTLGQYGKAELLYGRSLEIREAKLGKEHLDVAQSLNNLANLYSRMGQYSKAEPLYQRSLDITETKLGKDHPDLAQRLNNLASLYVTLGQYGKAEPLYHRSLDIREAKLGNDHLEVAESLNNLANLYSRIELYRKAEPLYQRSLDIEEAKLGKNNARLISSLYNLALLYANVGQLDNAEGLFQRSLYIARTQLGKNHPAVAKDLAAISVQHLCRDRPEKALTLQQECMQVHQVNHQNILSFSAEPAVYAYLDTISGPLDLLVNMAPVCKAGPKTALTWILRRKGIVLDTVCRFREAQQLLVEDKSVADSTGQLRSLRQSLANLALTSQAGVDPAKVQQEMDSLRDEADRLEGQLNRTLTERHGRQFADIDEVDNDRVQGRLGPETALVEVVRLRGCNYKKPGKELRWTTAHYFAFVLTAGTDPPRMIDLGSADEIDLAVKKVREQVERAPRELRLGDEKTLEADFRAAAADAYRLVFAPLQPALGQAKLIYVAADGELNRLAFEALPDGDGKYLVESMRFAYLSSGRDLLRSPTKSAHGTVVFAGPSYDLKAADRQAKAKELVAAVRLPGETGSGHAGVHDSRPALEEGVLRSAPPPDLRGRNFKALPGAAAEAEGVRQALQDSAFGPVKTFVGPEALEEVFKSIQPPRVLHIATHGFFLPDPKLDPKDREGPAIMGWDTSGLARLGKIENPLLRSGIVLAGANALPEENPPAGVDDGWVTAEEIALMNLRGTALVVLSACETGLGDIKTGEGVYGLRRAFIYAGARTLVTSLFQVPDEQTRQMMQTFYGGLKAGKGKLAALHDAQLEVVQQRRKDHGAAHPFFWASFVLVGDPE